MFSWIVTLPFTISAYQWPWNEIETLLILQQTGSNNRYKCAKGTLRAHGVALGCTSPCPPTPMLRWKERNVSCSWCRSCWSQTGIKYPPNGSLSLYPEKSVNQQQEFSTAKPRSSLSPPVFSFLHPQTHVNPGALCLTSTPRAEAVSEKGRETGLAGKEEVGKEEAAWGCLGNTKENVKGEGFICWC